MTRDEYRAFLASNPDLGSHDGLALLVLLRVSALTALGIGLSLQKGIPLWLLGQLALGIAFLQWFILVHDIGHRRFLSRPWMNDLAGQVASIMVCLPFYPWRHVHAHHHVWTGWKDVDATMSTIPSHKIPKLTKVIVDACWRFWIPIFSLAFSFRCFWNIPRLFRMFPKPARKREFIFSVTLLPVVYIALIAAVGFGPFMRVWGVAYLLFLEIGDPLLLSQHSHVPQQLARGAQVRPVRPAEQDAFTRSLAFPQWVSRWILLGFDNHIVHHFVPSAPCYRLFEIRKETMNRVNWWTWLKRAKAMPAHVLLLTDSSESGVVL